MTYWLCLVCDQLISKVWFTDPVYFAEIGEGVDWTGVLDLTADNIAGPALQVIAPAL